MKTNKIILFVGVVLILISVLASVFGYQDLQEISDLPLYDFFNDYPPIYYLGFFLIMPLIEEFVFRYWLQNKHKTVYILAVLSFVLFVFTQYYSIVTVLSISVFFSLLYVKEKWKQLESYVVFALVFLSAIYFGLAHLHTASTTTTYILLAYYSGLGFVLSFIRLKHGFKYSVISHYSYNFLILMLSTLFGSGIHVAGKEVVFQKDHYSVQVKTHGIFDFAQGSIKHQNDTLIYQYYSKHHLFKALVNKDYEIIAQHHDIPQQYSVRIFGNGLENSNQLLIETLLSEGVFSMDTIEEVIVTHVLTPQNEALLDDELQVGNFYLDNVKELLKINPKSIHFNTSKKAIKIDVKVLLSLKKMKEQELVDFFVQQYDMKVTEDSTKSICLVIQ